MPVPTAAELRAAFDAHAGRPPTVGLEEELMLLDPGTLDLAPRAPAVLARLGGDPRFKLELPASQLEIVTAPAEILGDAVAELAEGRRALAAAARGLARPAAAGVHPFASVEGELNPGERYERTLAEYGPIARRQLVCALQVHVAVGGAERTLAVYNALRGHLPALAALAANAPFHGGRDTGLASVRPKLAEGLPRQGVPPAIPTWEAFADALRWGAAAGWVPDARTWWWELRPHPGHGTLEVRVPDAQRTPEEAEAVAAVCLALVADLAARHEAGEPLGAPPTWRIAENRWSACRHGLEGELAHLETGERRPTREALLELVERLGPAGAPLGCAPGLAAARVLAGRGGAERQRAVAAQAGLRGLAAWLADGFEPA